MSLRRRIDRWIAASLLGLLVSTACASGGGSPQALGDPTASAATEGTRSADLERASALLLAESDGAAVPLPVPVPDPLADAGRLDRFNAKMQTANFWLLQRIVVPVAKGYNFVIPKILQRGIENVLHNLERPRDIVNSLLQAKPVRGGRHLAALIINSTLGVGGLFQVSHYILDDDSPETFNETLGSWGLPPGPYVVLPVPVSPFTGTSPRGLIGFAVDAVINPLFWIPYATSAISNTQGSIISAGIRVGGGLNAIASLMPKPWASKSEWDAFNELISEQTPYLTAKELFYENEALDVAD